METVDPGSPHRPINNGDALGRIFIRVSDMLKSVLGIYFQIFLSKEKSVQGSQEKKERRHQNKLPWKFKARLNQVQIETFSYPFQKPVGRTNTNDGTKTAKPLPFSKPVLTQGHDYVKRTRTGLPKAPWRGQWRGGLVAACWSFPADPSPRPDLILKTFRRGRSSGWHQTQKGKKKG